MKQMTLNKILLRILSALSFGILLILMGMIFFSFRLLQSNIQNHQRRFITVLANQNDNYLTETIQLLQTITANIADFHEDIQRKILTKTRQSSSRFDAFYLLNKTGRVVLESTDSRSLLDLDMSNRDSFQHVTQTGQTYISTPFYSLSTGKTTLTVAVPILQNDRVDGVFMSELNLTKVQENIERQIIHQEEAILFIVDQSGTVLAHPDQTWVQERRNLGDISIIHNSLTGQTTGSPAAGSPAAGSPAAGSPVG